MKDDSRQNKHEPPAPLPQWADCDFFCIHDYAGTGSSPCGWRGQLHEVRHDPMSNQFICPRCGCASLLRIPWPRPGQT